MRFTEPYFLDRQLSAGFDIFRVSRDFDTESGFQQRTTGFRLRMGYEILEDLTQALRYTLQSNSVRNIDVNASPVIQAEAGTKSTSSFGQILVYDKRNDKFDPTSGYFLQLDTDFAGLGGTQKFVRGRISGGYFLPLGGDFVLSFVGEYGFVKGIGGKPVALSDRFFLGGNGLRGFERGGVGPRDLTTDDSLGANQFYAGTIELTFPLGLPKEFGLRGRLWTDMGSAFGIDATSPGLVDRAAPRISVGVGISWKSPFGPIRVDVGFPVVKQGFDKKQLFNFTFGTRF